MGSAQWVLYAKGGMVYGPADGLGLLAVGKGVLDLIS
jgi:hypothetical protein